MSKRKRFGEILVEAGAVEPGVLAHALDRHKRTGKRLGQVLEEMKVISEKDIAAVLARQFGFKTVRGISRHAFSEEILALTNSEEALHKFIFPLKREGNNLFLAMVNPLDMETIDSLAFRTGTRITPCVTTPSEIHEAVSAHYLKRAEVEPSDWWRIVVADNQELARAAVAAALQKEGYSLVQAANGAEALNAIHHHPPHLVITDTVMPRMDGYQLFRMLQDKDNTRIIPVIALSSRSSAEEEAKLLDMGFFDFIPKPINPVRLLARIRRALKLVYEV